MDWLAEWGPTIVAIVGGLLTIASAITALTDTPHDDTVVDLLRRLLGLISVAQPKDAEGTLKLPGAKPGPLLVTDAKIRKAEAKAEMLKLAKEKAEAKHLDLP